MKYVAPVEVCSQRLNIKYLEELRELARRNRQNPTPAEYKMWNMVLRKNKYKQKFLRQKPINRYILDFYCSKLMLDIEIDGESHRTKYYQDKNRTLWLEIMGIKTIRYTNYQVLNDIDFVANDLFEKIKIREIELLSSPLFKGRCGEAERGLKQKMAKKVL